MKSRMARTSSCEPRLGQVVDPDRCRALAHTAGHRHDFHLRMFGGVGREEPAEPDPAARVPGRGHPVRVLRARCADHDRPGPVGLVLHLGPVDRHGFVVVVVGVQQRVPQAHVPEDAVGRAAADDQSLIVVEREGAHGIGGVAGRPAEGCRGHGVRGVHGVRCGGRQWHDAGLLAHPGRHGPDATRQVGVVLPIGVGWVVRPDVPPGPQAGRRVLQVVARDRRHGIGLELDPGHPVLGGPLGRQDEVEGPVGDPPGVAAVDGAHDPLGVAAVVGAAVHREREVDRVARLHGHPVGACWVDRRKAVERIGVVTAPFLVRADDLHEAGSCRVRPQIHLGGHLQDGEDPLVGLEQSGGVVRQLLDHARVGGGDHVQQLGEGRLRLGRHVPPGVSVWRRS